MEMDNVHLFTHKGCLDGAGAAIMFILAGGKRENIHYVTAGQLDRRLKDDEAWSGAGFLIYADLAMNDSATLVEMERRGGCQVIDHHISAQFVKRSHIALFDTAYCGTELVRQYLVENGLLKDLNAYRKLAALIEDHDLWRLNDNRSLDLAMLFNFYGQERFVEEFLNPELRFGIDYDFWKSEEAWVLPLLRQRRDSEIGQALESVEIEQVRFPDYMGQPLTVAYVFSGIRDVSLLLDHVLHENPLVDIACNVDPQRGVSMRSKGVDVSQVAGLFKGGGHRAAAGHPLPSGFRQMLAERTHASRR